MLKDQLQQDLIKAWSKFSAKDLKSAKILFQGKAYDTGIWHCHQALEKQLKSVMVNQGKPIHKTHDLPALLNDTGLKFPDEILRFTEDLNAYYQPSRYPDTALTNPLVFNRKTADKFIKLTETTIKWLRYHNKQEK